MGIIHETAKKITPINPKTKPIIPIVFCAGVAGSDWEWLDDCPKGLTHGAPDGGGVYGVYCPPADGGGLPH